MFILKDHIRHPKRLFIQHRLYLKFVEFFQHRLLAPAADNT